MGNAYNINSWVRTMTDPPEVCPGPDATPTFDPMFGFKNGRKERGKLNSFKLYLQFINSVFKPTIQQSSIFRCP